MAILWNGSLVPWTDPTGAPYSGAKVYFFDAGTTTPLTTYSENSLSIPNDHPVVANSGGSFPAIFFPDETVYRIRITTADDVTLFDVDNISAPTTTIPDPPTSDTEPQYLFQTGDMKVAWRTAAPTGWVRANGRTIGSSASAATERANDDCENLFEHLWTVDANLAVSGGRGATAAGDWAAAKTIVLPDMRGRSPFGLIAMGNSDTSRIVDADTTGGDADVLGASGGENRHALTLAENGPHDHGGSTGAGGIHSHTVSNIASGPGDGGSFERYYPATGTLTTNNSPAHSHTIASSGSGTAHNNMPPFVLVPWFIKL